MTAPAPSDAGTDNTPAPTPADMPPTAPESTHAAAEPTDDGDGKPDTSAEIARLKREAQAQRAKRREEEQAKAALEQALEELRAKTSESDDRWNKLASFFNPEADTPPDPEKLAAQFAEERNLWGQKTAEYDSKLSAAEQKIRDLTIQAALPDVCAKAGAKPGLTKKALIADGALAKLDPTSDTFAADLESAVAAAVAAEPDLKAAPVVRKSGAEIPGRSGGSDQLTREQIKGWSSAEIEKARSEGRLRNLLGG